MSTYPFPLESFPILGVRIDALTREKTLAVMDHWIRTKQRDYIVLTGAHGIVHMQDDPGVREINNRAGLVTPDGMPEVWLGRLAGHEDIEKVSAPDIMVRTFEASHERGYRHFFYGGKEGVADKLSGVLRESYAGIEIVGTCTPPFRPLTEREVADISATINRSEADVVWCGLGCPKQETWMDQFRPLLDAPVLIGVGAGFDFLSGEKPLAPKWIHQSGLEWLFRMMSEPKRLVPRYSTVVPRFIWLNLLEKLGLHRSPSPLA